MKNLLLIALFTTVSFIAFGSHSSKMWMKRPLSTWQNYPAGLRDIEATVTPQGIYAQVDLTFSIGPTTATSPADSQEAVIFFDLPLNSYVHDSWLWLDSNLASQAKLFERKKAIEVYSGIVKRKQDPSILYNTFVQAYQFNIYPVTSSFWRKVKISYSTPMQFRAGKAIVPLPTDLLAAAANNPSFKLNVATNSIYSNPAFASRGFGSWLSAQSGNLYKLDIPGGSVINTDLNLSFETPASATANLYSMPTASNEGYYELMVVPAPTSPAARFYNIIVDQKTGGGYDLYNPQELQRAVQGWLTSNLRSTDFFNIFYRNGGNVTSVFSNWHSADSAAMASIGPAFSGTPSSNESDLMALLIGGINFTKTNANAETIVLYGNQLYASSTQTSMFNLVKTAVSGLSNKLHVLNFGYYGITGGPYSYGSNVINGFLNMLSSATSGGYRAPRSAVYDNYTMGYLYDFNIKDELNAVVDEANTSTSSYQINLPVSGFTFGEYVTNRTSQFYPGAVYTESGQYYGSFPVADSVAFSYKLGTTFSRQAYKMNVSVSAQNQNKTWNYFNNRNLVALGTANRQAVIDSSINNRVLSDYTAFLALDIRDTVNKNNALAVNNAGIVQATQVKAYPNPFKSSLTIECKEAMESVQIYSFDGKLLRQVKLNKAQKWLWDGKDEGGATLPAGIYVIRVAGSAYSTAFKISKLD